MLDGSRRTDPLPSLPRQLDSQDVTEERLHDDETPFGIIFEQLLQRLDMETTVTHVHRAIHQLVPRD